MIAPAGAPVFAVTKHAGAVYLSRGTAEGITSIRMWSAADADEMLEVLAALSPPSSTRLWQALVDGFSRHFPDAVVSQKEPR